LLARHSYRRPGPHWRRACWRDSRYIWFRRLLSTNTEIFSDTRFTARGARIGRQSQPRNARRRYCMGTSRAPDRTAPPPPHGIRGERECWASSTFGGIPRPLLAPPPCGAVRVGGHRSLAALHGIGDHSGRLGSADTQWLQDRHTNEPFSSVRVTPVSSRLGAAKAVPLAVLDHRPVDCHDDPVEGISCGRPRC